MSIYSFQSYWAPAMYRKLLTFWNSDFILYHCPCYIFYHTWKMNKISLQICHNVKYRCTVICSSRIDKPNQFHISTGGSCKIELIWTSFMIFQCASKQIIGTWYMNISHIRTLLSKVHLDRSFVICNMTKQGNNSTTQNRKKCKEDLITHHGSPHVFVSVYTKTWIYIYVTKDCQHLFLTLNIMYYSQPECHYRGNYRLYIDENHLIMMDLKSYYID